MGYACILYAFIHGERSKRWGRENINQNTWKATYGFELDFCSVCFWKFHSVHVNVNNRKQLQLIRTLKYFIKVISDYLHTRSNTCNYMYKGMVWNLFLPRTSDLPPSFSYYSTPEPTMVNKKIQYIPNRLKMSYKYLLLLPWHLKKMTGKVLVPQLCLMLCHPIVCPWYSLGRNTGVGCLYY